MALTKEKKHEVVKEVAEALGASKMTVVAKYQGLTVKDMQQLRRNARDGGTSLRVVKNRLVKQAVQDVDTLKGLDTSALTGQLLYAFNPDDEVAPAQVLAAFAKSNPAIEFVGAITAQGTFITPDEVKALAEMPSRETLIAQVIATLGSPLNDTLSGLSGNLHALLDGIEAKASN
jgi:large subunit ribosomal protein L10